MLQANQRQPCGSVVQVFWDAIPEWNVYESQKGWIVSGKSKVSGKSHFEADMKSEPRWAITAPAVKGAVGLVLCNPCLFSWTVISHHDEKRSNEIRNNRASTGTCLRKK